MGVLKGPSKIVNIFPYKQNSCNFLAPPPTVMTNVNMFVVCVAFSQMESS